MSNEELYARYKTLREEKDRNEYLSYLDYREVNFLFDRFTEEPGYDECGPYSEEYLTVMTEWHRRCQLITDAAKVAGVGSVEAVELAFLARLFLRGVGRAPARRRAVEGALNRRGAAERGQPRQVIGTPAPPVRAGATKVDEARPKATPYAIPLQA
jgi:hypothetical protein